MASTSNGAPRRLVVVGLQHGRIDVDTLPALARLVAGHRPDLLLLVVGLPGRRPRPGAGRTSTGVGQALAAFRGTYQGPIELQLPPGVEGHGAAGPAPQHAWADLDRLHQLHVRMLPPRHEVAPGWLCTTATGATSGYLYPGLRALDLARRTGQSLILGGTDLSGMIGETTLAPDGTSRTLWGLEIATLPVGCPTRERRLTAGLGILEVNPSGPTATPTLVPIPAAMLRQAPGARLDHV